MKPALIAALLLGCQSPPEAKPEKPAKPTETRSDKAKAHGPTTPQPLLPPGQTPSPCVEKCVQSMQMQARAIEAIEADCRKQCETKK